MSIFEKLRFRDGLGWTVGLTVEMKLRFKFLQGSMNEALAKSLHLAVDRSGLEGLKSCLKTKM